jgi:uncharacterized protein (DUF608 family)
VWTSGIPLGGIGTGSVEIRPDGGFSDWLIFNLGPWAGGQPADKPGQAPQMGDDALMFTLYTREGRNEPKVRRLTTRANVADLYARSFAMNVEEIVFEGRFPVARLDYLDASLPVEVTGQFLAPFVPHDARTSGTPGFIVVFTLRNRSKSAVTASLAATLRNPLAWGDEDRRLRNEVITTPDTTYLTMRTEAEMAGEQTIGSIGLSVTGGQPGWIAGEWSAYMGNGEWVRTPNGATVPSWLREFRDDGRLPNSSATTSSARMLRLTNEEIAALPTADKRRAAAQMQEWALFRFVKRRMARVDPTAMSTDAGLEAYLRECRDCLNDLAGEDRSGQSWGDGALGSTVTLAPGETKEIVFTIAWHFPNHYSRLGPDMGHRYEEWFRDAEGVNLFLTGEMASLRRKVASFADALHDTSLGPAMAQAWSSQLTTLVKSTWWVKDGRFGVWEGLGCCGFQTMDITYQGSHSLAALFPELQQTQMRMSAGFQREDGRVPHFFTPDLLHVDNGFDRVDMNPQFVMLVCRDYLWTGDRQYLQDMWPHVQQAIKNISLLDSDGDGLPDKDTRRNTYDQWDFRGAPAYIGSLWIGSLLAAIRMAKDLGDAESEALYRRMHDRAVKAFDETLWTGSYYSLFVDGAERDECCMTDQLSGEGFTGLIGLGFSLPAERIRTAYKSVMRHNFTHERGLLNASYPPDKKASFPTYLNAQADANWTGIEYTMASSLLDVGMAAEARAVVASIHERYRRAGRTWNHVECGNHYYRAMASWAVLNAATGFKPDVPRETLTIAPPVASVRAPWFASTGWGTLNASPRELRLGCRSGRIAFRTLRVSLTGKTFTAKLAGAPVPVTATRVGAVTVLDFGEAVSLAAGRTLAITSAQEHSK